MQTCAIDPETCIATKTVATRTVLVCFDTDENKRPSRIPSSSGSERSPGTPTICTVRNAACSFMPRVSAASTSHLELQNLQNFGGLVLGCIKTKFRKKICVWQHFSSSTKFASFCTAAISKFSQKIGLKNQQFLWKFSKNFANVAKFAKFCQISKISAR